MEQITPELQAVIDAYEARRAKRVEHFKNRAVNAERRSTAAWKASNAATDGIPFGQPILVGHHSERRHRNALRRADRAMRRCCEESDKSKYWDRRADAVESDDAIRSEDPAAVLKLKARILELECEQARMKAINAAIRKGAGWEARVIPPLTEKETSELSSLARCWGKVYKPGYPPYALQNKNANIRRLKNRLAILSKAVTVKAVEVEGNGVTVTENPISGRLELRFPGKPSPDLIVRLKAAYWVARRKDGEWFWMSHRTEAARALASELSGGAYAV